MQSTGCLRPGRRAARLAKALGLLLTLASRSTFAEEFTCATRTGRDAEKIVIPLADSESPGLPDQAVRIAPGEVLCLTGTRTATGELDALRLVERAENANGPVVRLEMTRAAGSELRVRHSSPEWLEYRALIVVTQQEIAAPTTTLPVAPGVEAVELWTRGVRQLLLYGFRLRGPQQPAEHDRTRRNVATLNASVTFGFWGGERGVRLGGLNDALARDGFTPLPYAGAEGGLDLDFTFGRVRTGISFGAGGRTSKHRDTGAELSTWLSEVGFTAGLDAVRYDQLSAFVSSGVLFGNLYVDARAKGSTLFPDLKEWEGERVVFSHTALPLDVGTDYLLPLGRASPNEQWVLQFGMRVGWLWQLDGSWGTDRGADSRGIGGPPVDVTGPRARLVLGIGAQNGW